ncbi:MAG: hypothetical protein AAAC47_10800 [Pararhizobium sp.]
MLSLLSRKYQLYALIAAILAAEALVTIGYLAITGELPPLQRLFSSIGLIVGSVLVGIGQILWRPIWRWFPWLARRTFPDLNGEGRKSDKYVQCSRYGRND